MASSSSSSPEIPAATCTEPLPRFSYKDASQDEVLEDLSSRFILNLPDEELASLERLCFQVEQAHWFYEDFIREENTKLPSLPLKRFSEMLFHACPLLQQWSDDHEQAFNTFMQYKTRVPVCGAIMLNDTMDKCVLVKGWKASAGWGFPKGKINEVEPPPTCAIREVLEETGYNLAGLLNPDDVIELSIKEQKISLFIVSGVPEDFPFKTKTRKEISKIEWFKLTDLPTWKKNKAAPGRFYLIAPFMGRLKAWINDHKRINNTPRKNSKQKKTQPPASISHPRNGVATRDNDPIPESISKSSSVEDLGPQTPSPRQVEPATNSTPSDVEMDPQLARLLSSLTLSAASRDKVNHVGKAEPAHNPQQFDSSSSSESSVDSPITSHIHEQPDWSSSAPPYISLATGSVPQSSPSRMSLVEPSRSSIIGKASLPPLANENAIQYNHSLFSSVNDGSSSSLHPPISPTSPRKSSSTADISPYLARTKEAPTSGKLLQQLSLLEAVADESAKMAPIIAARAAMASRGPASNGYQIQPPFVTQALPARDMLPSYAYSPAVPSSAVGFHPRYPLENAINGYQDPFQVRPRTSQAFQRSLMHSHNPTGSVSINHGHLPPNINSVPGIPMGSDFQMAPHFIHHQRIQMSNANTSLYGPTNPTQYQPAIPPQFLMDGYNSFSPDPLPPSLASIRPYSTVNPINPIITPGTNTGPNNGRNPNSLALLSILNGRAN